jgi:ferric-dicitrate binding protein FerR (iron transport regulator)
MALNELIHRFLENQAELSPEDFDALIAGLREQPGRAAALREQLMVDCLLAQKLSLDRRNFLAQVEQRIADYERSEEEIDSQVVELRELAAAEIERPAARHRQSLWVQGVLAVSLAAILAAVFVVPRFLPRQPHAVARVKDVEGAVTATQDAQSTTLADAATLFAGQEIATPAGGSLEIEYEDRSVVKIAGDSVMTVDSEPTSGAKRISIERGQLWADVAPQTDGAMQIVTPHAVATVLGTQFRLTVDADDTLLEVSEGEVRLDRIDQAESITVADNESGLASDDVLDHRTVKWPEDTAALAFAFDPFTRTEGLFRNPESGNLNPAEYEVVGSAAANRLRGLVELSGGCLRELEGGRDIVTLSQSSSQFSLELVFTPAPNQPNSPARIVSLEGEAGSPNFVLSQAGNQLLFEFLSDGGDQRPLAVPLPASRPLHVTLSCQDGAMVAYVAGKAVAQRADQLGSLATWTHGPLVIGADGRGHSAWHGTIEALAIYHRAVAADEAARNVHHYRLLAGRP